jgi:hypothetical protein
MKRLHKIFHFCGKFWSFRGRDPLTSQALSLNPTKGQQLPQKFDPSICRVITIQVMAVPQVSPTHKYTVCSLLKGKQDVVRGNAGRTHHPYDPDI